MTKSFPDFSGKDLIVTAILLQELEFFKDIVARRQTHNWLVAAVLGFIMMNDSIGCTSSMIRALGLGLLSYRGLLGFFASSAVDIDRFQQLILAWMKKSYGDNVVKIGGKYAFVLDAKKRAKEGKKMPLVKWLHQESSSNAKGEYIRGHCAECIGLLVKHASAVHCLIWAVNFIEGFKLHNRDNSTTKDRAATMVAGYAVQMANALLICDAWYAAKQILASTVGNSLTIVTRVAKNAVACYDPVSPKKRMRGAPRKYGEPTKLMELFATLIMSEATIERSSGEKINVSYWSIVLMWPAYGKKVLFVGTCNGIGKLILLCTDVNMNPVEVIQAYQYRSSIEATFWTSTQLFFNWTYRFWSKAKFTKDNLRGSFNLHFLSPKERTEFWAKVGSYRLFLTIGFFAHALLLKAGSVCEIGRKRKNLLFFRSANRGPEASIAVLKSIVQVDYIEFLQRHDGATDSGIFLRKLHARDAKLRRSAA
jgi:hypothetical protein